MMVRDHRGLFVLVCCHVVAWLAENREMGEVHFSVSLWLPYVDMFFVGKSWVEMVDGDIQQGLLLSPTIPV